MSFIIFKGLSVAKNGNRPGSAPLGSLEIFFESLYAPYVYSVFFWFICFNLLFIFTCCPHLQALLRNVSDVFKVWVLFCTCISYCWIVSPSKFEVYKKVKTHRSITIRKWIIPKSFVKFSSTPILKNICERLLLSFMLEKNAGVLLCSIVLETCLQKLITGFNVRQLDILKYFRVIFSLKKANYPIFVFV